MSSFQTKVGYRIKRYIHLNVSFSLFALVLMACDEKLVENSSQPYESYKDLDGSERPTVFDVKFNSVDVDEFSVCATRVWGGVMCWERGHDNVVDYAFSGIRVQNIMIKAGGFCGVDSRKRLHCFNHSSKYPVKTYKNVEEFGMLGLDICYLRTDGKVNCGSGMNIDVADSAVEIAANDSILCSILQSRDGIVCHRRPPYDSVERDCFGHTSKTEHIEGVYMDVEMGENDVCAIDYFGRVDCWNVNRQCDLGKYLGPTRNIVPSGAVRFSVGSDGAVCVINFDNKMICYNEGGEYRAFDSVYETVSVDTKDSICAIDMKGRLECWGQSWMEGISF